MNRTAAALLLVGLLQMTGDVLETLGAASIGRPLKAIGAASTASPAPRVFSASRGLETYSTAFRIAWIDSRGTGHEVLLTPQVYARIKGPYNRRNVYGAAVAYGPLLASTPATAALFQAVAEYALCGDAPLLRELGIDPAGIHGVRVIYEPLPGSSMGNLPRAVDAPCR